MIIAAFRNDQTQVYTKSVHQFDKGQKLIITGIALPDSFEVHMSNSKENGLAYSCKGKAEGVYIPDAMFLSGEYVYIWVYATSVEAEEAYSQGYVFEEEEESISETPVSSREVKEGESCYEIVIPVIRRPAQLPTRPDDPTTDDAIDAKSISAIGYTVDDDETLIPVTPF